MLAARRRARAFAHREAADQSRPRRPSAAAPPSARRCPRASALRRRNRRSTKTGSARRRGRSPRPARRARAAQAPGRRAPPGSPRPASPSRRRARHKRLVVGDFRRHPARGASTLAPALSARNLPRLVLQRLLVVGKVEIHPVPPGFMVAATLTPPLQSRERVSWRQRLFTKAQCRLR